MSRAPRITQSLLSSPPPTATGCLSAASEWEACFDDRLDRAAAEAASRTGAMPGEGVRHFRLGDALFNLETLTDGKIMPIGSRALLLSTVEACEKGVYPFNITANWRYQVFVNGAMVFDTGSRGHAREIRAVGRRIDLPLEKGGNRVAVLIERVAAYQTWGFAFWPMPDTANWPRDPDVRRELFETLFPEKTPVLRYRPWITHVSTDHAEIGAIFTARTAAALRFRATDGGNWSEVWSESGGRKELFALHRFFLDGLEPGTGYEYELIRLDEEQNLPVSMARGVFRTFPDTPGKFRFCAFSDLQNKTLRPLFTADMIQLRKLETTDFIVSLGDLDNMFDRFDEEYFGGFTDVLARCGCHAPFFPVRGNHEYRGSNTERYVECFGEPYYAFRRGDAFFIVLDTGEGHYGNPRGRIRQLDRPFMERQARWFAEVIRSEECRTAAKRIIFAHATPFEWESAIYSRDIRTITGGAIFGDDPECPIDLWICGDTHSPYRFDPATGKCSGPPRNEAAPLTERDKRDIRFPVFVNDGPGFAGDYFTMIDAEVDPDGITLCCISDRKEVVDHIRIEKNRPIKVLASGWKEWF